MCANTDTHQLVRTRTGKYAQQSQRTVDVRGNSWENNIENDYFHNQFDALVTSNVISYASMINNGVPVQDARGILPTNIHTEIIAQFDLRTLHNMALTRLCVRTQGEYQRVFKAMVKEIARVHPWAEQFIKVQCAWNGTCAFPRYTECPVQPLTMRPATYQLKDIEDKWDEINHEAIPVAKDGVTM